MRHSFRSLVAAVVAIAQPLEATAQAAGPIYDFSPTGRYFRYRVEGIDVHGVNVTVRGPTEVVVTGAATSVESRVRGGAAPYVFEVASGALPEGMTLNPSTGVGTGAATKAGRYTFAIRAMDANGQAGVSLPYTIVVQNQKLEISRSPSLSAPYGKPYSDRLSAVGGRQPYAWSVAQGALPPGIVLDQATGALSGTPTALGQYLFRAQVADADGARALSTEYVLFVDDATLSIAGSAPAKAQVGVSFAGRYAAAGGKSPYTYTLSGLPLPPGLDLDFDTGWIKGTPAQAGEYTGLRVRATDATARFVDASYFSVSVVAALAAEWSGSKAAVGTPYDARVRRTGGRGPYVFSLASGALPPGLTLRPGDGGIAGVPTTAGTFGGLVVRVADADGRVVHTPSFDIQVSNELTVVGVPTRIGTRSIAYSSPTAVGGGLKPYGYSLGAGTLPAGLSLDGSTGIVSGVPSAPGLNEGIRIRVTDATGKTTLSDPFAIEVRDRLVVSTAGMPAYHSLDADYDGTLTATGGATPYQFAIDGTLPPGLFLDSRSGKVLGTAKYAGTYGGLLATAKDSEGRTATSQTFAITVSNPLAAQAPSSYATVNQAFSSTVQTTGGRAPLVFTSRTALPDGLWLDPANGIISGTATKTGTTAGIVIDVVDADGRTASTQPFDITVESPASVVAVPQRAIVVSGVESSTSAPVVTGGTAPFTYSLKGRLPATLKIDPATGAIGGTTADAPDTIYSMLQIVATDARGRSSESNTFGIRVAAPLSISYATSKLGFDVQNYFSQRYPATATGGCGDVRWTMSGNTPPDIGVSENDGTVLPLRPLRYWDEGSFPGVTVTAKDACGVTATAQVDLDVQPEAPYGMAKGQTSIFAPVGQTFRTEGASVYGLSSIRFAIFEGSLPEFLTLDTATGVVSGIVPASTANGTQWNYRLFATDEFGRRAFVPSIKVTAVTPPTLSYQNGGRLPFQTTTWNRYVPTVTGGCTTSSWQVTAGSLPAGVALRYDGAIEPTGGTMSVGTAGPTTITLRDSCNQTASTDVTVDVRTGDVAATAPSQLGLVAGEASRTDAMTFTGFAPDVVYSLVQTSASLPSGISLDANRRFAGTLPAGTSPGTKYGAFVYTATDGFGRTAQTPAFYLTALAPPQIGYAASTSGSTGKALSLSPTVSGGATPYTYQLTGTLPAGLTFSTSNGIIQGSPTGAASASNLVVRVTDASGVTKASNAFAITVTNAVAVTGAPADGKTGTAYSHTFSATGGQGTLTFSTQSTLPAGLTLSAAGVLSGTPTAAGTYPFSVTASDAYGRSGSLSVSMNVVQSVTAGTWMSWGTGQLGDGKSSSVSYVPRQATALQQFSSIAVTGDGTTACGIAADKAIWCWGNNKWGKLGNGSDVTAPESSTSTVTPVKINANDTWAQVVAGADYFCALNTGSYAYCWGPNGSGTGASGIFSTPSSVGLGYVRLATSPSGRTTCGIKNDGYAYCWGALGGPNMTYGQSPRVVPSAGTDRWTRIAPGTSTICGIQTDGTLWCWGSNGSGELGKGYSDGNSAYVPTQIGTKSDWTEVVNNGSSICGIDAAGSGWCWGSGANGQLGTGTNSGIYAPTRISGYAWKKLAASGVGSMCGIDTSDRLLCWGKGSSGQLGNLATSDRTSPTLVEGPVNTFSDVAVTSVAYGLPIGGGSAAKTGGNLYAWGWADGLGNGATSDSTAPVKVLDKADWAGTTGGLLFGCAWDVAGEGSCWGQNTWGQLGTGSGLKRLYPTTIAGGRKWSRIAAGYTTACGVTTGNELFCWGANDKGQAGTGAATTSYNSPQQVAGGTRFEQVFSGGTTTSAFCALDYSGALSCWGDNARGMIGNATYPTSQPVTVPRAVSGGHVFRTAAIGDSAVCAIKTDNSIWCWGQNNRGQFARSDLTGSQEPARATQTNSGSWVSIAAAGDSFCAIRTDGRLFCWGANPEFGALYGDAGAPSYIGNLGTNATPYEVKGGGTWASITGALGYTAFCGTRTNGQTSCWGQNMGPVPNPGGSPSPMTSPLGTQGGLLGLGMGMRNGYGIR